MSWPWKAQWKLRWKPPRTRILYLLRVAWTSGLFFGWAAPCAFAEDSSEIRLLLDGPGIPGLHWSTDSIDFRKKKTDSGEQGFFVTLKGTFDEPHTDVLWNMRKIVSTESKLPEEFNVQVQVSSPATIIRVRSINARGEISRSSYMISIPDYQRRVVIYSAPSRLKFSGSVGYSTIQYNEGSTVSLSMSGITAKATLGYQIVPKEWDAALNCYITALPLSQNLRPQTRFLGVNARVGYTIPEITAPFSLSVMGGFYYTTMIVTNGTFGFHNLLGPQLFPSLRYQLSTASSLGTYFKYSPIVTENGLLPFSQREFAVGLNFTYLLSDGHPLSASVDFADLRLTIGRVAIVTTSLSFSVGYAW